MSGGQLPPPPHLLMALGATWLVEWAGLMLALRRGPRHRDGLTLLAINGLTNPLAHVAHHLGGLPLIAVEAGVVAAEAFLMRGLLTRHWRSAILLSLLLNALSASLSVPFGWLLG